MPINTIMYHYVRNNENYPYDTYCRRIEEFRHQIDLFIAKSKILNPADKDEINYYLNSTNDIGYLITFDDGYIDHYDCAKYLASKNCSGYFFPVIDAIEGKLLDVNAIHILIGNRENKIQNMLTYIKEYCLKNEIKVLLGKKLVDIEYYMKNIVFTESKDRFDKEEIIVLKRLLQRDIPETENRNFICTLLLKEFYGDRYKRIVQNLYLDVKKMRKMKKLGMLFGSHGCTHRWLQKLTYDEQKRELTESVEYLKKLELIEENDPICICYPYGSYNDNTLRILNEINADIGFTTKVGASKIDKKTCDVNFLLERWDTNDCWDSEFRKPILPRQ